MGVYVNPKGVGARLVGDAVTGANETGAGVGGNDVVVINTVGASEAVGAGVGCAMVGGPEQTPQPGHAEEATCPVMMSTSDVQNKWFVPLTSYVSHPPKPES